MDHPVTWLTPKPLWSLALQDGSSRARYKRPALLRFDAENFMEQVTSTLASEPEKLSDLVARPETWRVPAVGWQSLPESAGLKLFQVSQQRFYLVGASLVCKIPGLPDRSPAAGEEVYFSLRRLVPTNANQAPNLSSPASYTEYVWINRDGIKRWNPVGGASLKVKGQSKTPAELEERLQLFPLCYDENGKMRRVWFGFLPVDNSETYVDEAQISEFEVTAADLAGDPLNYDPRVLDFANLAAGGFASIKPWFNSDALTTSQARETFLFAAAETAVWLHDFLPEVWQAMVAGSSAGLSASMAAVYSIFSASFYAATPTYRWRQVLVQVYASREQIFDGTLTQLTFNGVSPSKTQLDFAITNLAILESNFTVKTSVMNALDAAIATTSSTETSVTETIRTQGGSPKLEDGAYYIVRYHYYRPNCRADHRTTSSAPSALFQLAGFFDADAPYRPIRIRLPGGTDLKDLRKFPKAVSVMMSDNLRRQMQRFQGKKASDVEDGDLNSEGGFNLGMICSLSIPIITIVAMMLLLIFVFVLNIVFFWIPLFKICLPLNFKSK